MNFSNKKEPVILFLGDIVFFVISLWLTLFIRHFEFPETSFLKDHLYPFSILFLSWVVIFYTFGLYEKHTLILKNSLPNTIFKVQIINSIIAVLFFYFIPFFGITPKTNLFLYSLISFILILTWRLKIFFLFYPRKKQKAILIGAGEEMKELKNEVNNNSRYDFNFVRSVDLNNYDTLNFDKDIVDFVYENGVSVIVVDIKNPNSNDILPQLYNLIFAKVQFIDKYKFYEILFDRIPLSMVGYSWFLENISSKSRITYDFLKRLMDIFIGGILFIFSLPFYPIVAYLIWREDKGSVLIKQERIGKGNRKIYLLKFRSMKVNDGGVWPKDGDERITKIGKFIRKSRIDELPQLWNVLKGDISLIGPRPDIIDLFNNIKDQIPYYTIRNIVKPGLSGWAQTHQEIPPHSLEETKIRLAYDLFYIKNRSLLLDLKIALQTLKTLFFRTGK